MSLALEQIRKQVDRVVHSRTFGTSEVHRHLLEYLAEQSLAGDGDGLKEYTIGLEAFGKSSNYDPRHDSIVRFQAGRLRQKLVEYYRSEAAAEEIRISFPKGGFKLVFEEGSASSNGVHWRETRNVWLPRIMAAALLLSIIWAVIATYRMARAEQAAAIVTKSWTPDLQTLWEPFLNNARPVLVCLGTPLFLRFPGYGFFRDPKANDWREAVHSERVFHVQKALEVKDIAPSFSFTGAGEASAAVLIARLLGTKKGELVVTRSNLLTWQQIADYDVVFIGPPKFNPQLNASLIGGDIVVEPGGIRNRKPRQGESEFLADHFVQGPLQEGETHALISRIPHPSGKRELLMIAGNASPDTLAAAEWITDPGRARELVQRLRGGGSGMPRHFQAVIKVSFKQGVPVSSSYVFHHGL